MLIWICGRARICRCRLRRQLSGEELVWRRNAEGRSEAGARRKDTAMRVFAVCVFSFISCFNHLALWTNGLLPHCACAVIERSFCLKKTERDFSLALLRSSPVHLPVTLEMLVKTEL